MRRQEGRRQRQGRGEDGKGAGQAGRSRIFSTEKKLLGRKIKIYAMQFFSASFTSVKSSGYFKNM